MKLRSPEELPRWSLSIPRSTRMRPTRRNGPGTVCRIGPSTSQAPLDAWELTKDGPGTQTLKACHDLRDGVPGREGAKDMDMVGTDLHFLHGDVILLRNIGKEFPYPLLDLPLQDVSPVLGRPD